MCPAGRVVAFARSPRSLDAIELACRLPSLGGLVLESGIASPFEKWKVVAEADEIGGRIEEIEAVGGPLRPSGEARRVRRPVLVLQAEPDQLVPRSHTEGLHASAGGAGKRSVLFPHGDHTTLISANAAGDTAERHAFLKRPLR